jgi:hypothetical protein
VLLVTTANRKPYAMLSTISASRARATDRYEVVLGAPLADGSPRRLKRGSRLVNRAGSS